MQENKKTLGIGLIVSFDHEPYSNSKISPDLTNNQSTNKRDSNF